MRAGITIFVYNENILSEVYLLPSVWFNTFISLSQSLVEVQSPDCTTAWKVSKYGVFSGPYLETFHVVVLSAKFIFNIVDCAVNTFYPVILYISWIFDCTNITCLSLSSSQCIFPWLVFRIFIVSCVWISLALIHYIRHFVDIPPRTG